MAVGLALRYAHQELVTDEQLQAMGAALWRALDADAALERARAAAGLGVLPLVIESSEPAVL